MIVLLCGMDGSRQVRLVTLTRLWWTRMMMLLQGWQGGGGGGGDIEVDDHAAEAGTAPKKLMLVIAIVS